MEINEISHKMRIAGEEWADLNAAADALEESKKSVLAQIMNKSEGSVAAREIGALADKTYLDHLTGMVEARRLANKSRVRYDTIRVWVELYRTSEATKRAEMKIL